MNAFAQASFIDFSAHQERQWLNALAFERNNLRDAIARDMGDPEKMKARMEWFEEWKANDLKGQSRGAEPGPSASLDSASSTLAG
jgi:hypothetical protein